MVLNASKFKLNSVKAKINYIDVLLLPLDVCALWYGYCPPAEMPGQDDLRSRYFVFGSKGYNGRILSDWRVPW
jgi:hypothetical protein